MKLSTLVLAAASVAALSATASFAQNSQDKPMVGQSMATGKPVVMVPMTANAKDMYMTSWVYRNLDDREVKRFHAQGFTDPTIKGAANIAMRVGVPVEFVLRQVREVGTPLATVALNWNVPTSVVNADIPGYGLESMSITTPMSGGMMNNGSMQNGSMNNGGMNNGSMGSGSMGTGSGSGSTGGGNTTPSTPSTTPSTTPSNP